MKITKGQLRRIIREEKSRLLSEMTPADAGFAAARMGDHINPSLKMMAAVIDNLTEMALGYDVDEDMKGELLMQVELLQDIYRSLHNKTVGYPK